jgi:hypothetical protein
MVTFTFWNEWCTTGRETDGIADAGERLLKRDTVCKMNSITDVLIAIRRYAR